MSTQTREQPKTKPTTGPPVVAHIVKPQGKQSAAALVTEARVFGHEVEALCGHRWIPSRSAAGLPVCEACKEIWGRTFGQPDGWSDA